jgi:hypothetical protein
MGTQIGFLRADPAGGRHQGAGQHRQPPHNRLADPAQERLPLFVRWSHFSFLAYMDLGGRLSRQDSIG